MNFLKKSKETREQDLTEAYKTMVKYREGLSVLSTHDLCIKPYEVMMIQQEKRKVDEWIAKHSSAMSIMFEITEPGV